jgi:hypothetical protein
MSVWPETTPGASPLSGSDGMLVSISISVAPRHLESLLDALARINFPVNPQIYHDAAVVYRYAGGAEDCVPVTLVEFPAYDNRLTEVARALEAYGFDPASMQVTRMLDHIHTDMVREPVPPGAPYVERYRVKNRELAAVH